MGVENRRRVAAVSVGTKVRGAEAVHQVDDDIGPLGGGAHHDRVAPTADGTGGCVGAEADADRPARPRLQAQNLIVPSRLARDFAA